MLYPPCTLYVIECETPRTFYVGTTYRQKQKRFDEHFSGRGCKWTERHGCRRVVSHFEVPIEEATQLENEVWMWYARQYGPERVRGGDVTMVQRGTDALPDWVLPQEFGGTRVVQWG